MCQLDPSPHSKIFCMLAKNLLPNKKWIHMAWKYAKEFDDVAWNML
jgi:hypothetical protein